MGAALGLEGSFSGDFFGSAKAWRLNFSEISDFRPGRHLITVCPRVIEFGCGAFLRAWRSCHITRWQALHTKQGTDCLAFQKFHPASYIYDSGSVICGICKLRARSSDGAPLKISRIKLSRTTSTSAIPGRQSKTCASRASRVPFSG